MVAIDHWGWGGNFPPTPCSRSFNTLLLHQNAPQLSHSFAFHCVQRTETQCYGQTTLQTSRKLSTSNNKKNVRITAPFYNSRDVSQKVANGASSDIRTMKKLYPIRLAQNLAVANGKGGERERAPPRVMLEKRQDTAYRIRFGVPHYSHCSAFEIQAAAFGKYLTR